MPKTSKQCQQIKEERRNDIIETALHLFCLCGYSEVSIDDICKELEISHGLFYHYFNNKEDVQKAIFEKAKETFDSKIDCLDLSKKGIDFIEEFNSFYLQSLRAGKLNAYFTYFAIDRTVSNRMSTKDKNKPSNRLLIDAIKEGQKNHQIVNGNIMEIYYSYISLLRGLAYSIIKSKKDTDYVVPSNDIVMNLFYKKEIK